MYRRRDEPYSKTDQLKRSRYELIGLVFGGILLGFLINILAGAVTEWLQTQISNPIWLKLWFWFGVLLALILFAVIFFLIYYRGETQHLKLEVMIPYLLSGKTGFRIAPQHPYRPHYLPADVAARIFMQHFGKNSKEAIEIGKQWERERSKSRKNQGNQLVQDFLRDYNIELVDTLIVQAMDKFSEDASGESAQRDWWYVPIQCKEVKFSDFPAYLQKNRFLKSLYGHTPTFYIHLPENVEFSLEPHPFGMIWLFHHKWFGDIRIFRYGGPMIEKYRNASGRVLGEGLAKREEKFALVVFRNRIELSASFKMTFLPRMDRFERWATHLFSNFEEALDWNYYMDLRPDRLIVDIPWKIGDVPANGSIWRKLEDIESRLIQIEKNF